MANKIELIEGNKVKVFYEGVIESPHLYTHLSQLTNQKDRIAALERAIKIGGHALSSNAVSSLLSELERSLDNQLSPLRVLVEKRATVEAGSQSKGAAVERQVHELLSDFAKSLNFTDRIERVGDAGADQGIVGAKDRKFGDVLVHINDSDTRLVFESKADSKVTLGDTTDTPLKIENARGQTRASQANRNSPYAVFVTEKNSAVHRAMKADLLVSHKDMAIFVMIDRNEGEYENLRSAYIIGRALALSLTWPVVEQQHLRSVAAIIESSLGRVKKMAGTIEGISNSAASIKKSAETLLGDFGDELQKIDRAMDYLTSVASSSSQDMVDLKLQELELLTGKKFTRKSG